MRYHGNEFNEYDRLMELWSDIDYLYTFFSKYNEFLKNDVWSQTPNIESAIRQVLQEAISLETFLETLADNTDKGIKPDFDSHFHYLEGKYKFIMVYQPMKSYGPHRPSFIRLYAIKISDNCYLITGGGIKLAHTIQDSPELDKEVFQKIDGTLNWLKVNGILDASDLINT